MRVASFSDNGVLRREHYDDSRQQSPSLQSFVAYAMLTGKRVVRCVRPKLHDDIPPPGHPKWGLRGRRVDRQAGGYHHLCVSTIWKTLYGGADS